MPDQPRPLLSHLEELRKRLFWSALALVIGGSLAGYFYKPIIEVLLVPAAGHLSASSKPIFTEMTELLGLIVKICVLGGVVVALPFLLYQIAMFIAPALNPAERRLARLFVPVAFLSFVAGVSFAYFVLLPPGIRFLLTFGSDIAQPMIRISSYVNLVLTLVVWVGLVFETPLIMFLLARLRIVSYKTFARVRRYTFVAAFILGAIITPTFDPFNQSLVALPLVFLYEVGIFLAWLVRPREKCASSRAAASGSS